MFSGRISIARNAGSITRSAVLSAVALLPAVATMPCSAAGQERRDSTIVMEEVVVVDSLSEGDVRPTIRTSVIDARRLAFRTGESVAGLLDAESFLFIQRAGPTGLATASLRGAGSVHTRILLDGMRLADPQTGQVDVTTLPASFIESITIGHGGAATASAKSALGGTVQLQTLQPGEDARFRVSMAAGAYGRVQLGALASGRVGPVRALAAFDGAEFDGSFPFASPGARGPEGRRDNADRSSRNVYLRAETSAGTARWFASAWVSEVERGVPGPANAPPAGARQQDKAVRIWGGRSGSLPGGSLDVRVSYARSRLNFKQPEPTGASHSRTQTVELTADLARVVSARWVADAAGAMTYEDAALRDGRSEVTGRLRGGVSNATGRVLVNPSLGLELFRGPRGQQVGALPALSVRVDLNERASTPTERTSVPLAGAFVRAGAARIVRAPTFNDRYWLPGGNPDLKPETGWSADTGLGLSLDVAGLSLETEATLFGSLLHDKIVWQPALTGPSVQSWSPGNVGRVIGGGLEWSASVTARHSAPFTVRLRSAYTYARMEDRTNRRAASWARQLRYVPEHVLKLHLALDAGWTGLDVLLNMTGKRYVTSDESQWLRPNHDLSVRLRAGFSIPGGRIRASVALENALDAALESMRFYPLPPRHLGFALVFERGP